MQLQGGQGQTLRCGVLGLRGWKTALSSAVRWWVKRIEIFTVMRRVVPGRALIKGLTPASARIC